MVYGLTSWPLDSLDWASAKQIVFSEEGLGLMHVFPI